MVRMTCLPGKTFGSVDGKARNARVVEFEQFAVLFSYETLVAVVDYTRGRKIRTAHSRSVTTSAHITAWRGKDDWEERPQTWFDHLLDDVTLPE